MNKEVSETLFQAVDEILTARLNEIKFDKTDTCQIIQAHEDKANVYLVSNGSLKFEAKSLDEGKKYTKDQKVYVTIPNGDYSADKIILGSVTEEELSQ